MSRCRTVSTVQSCENLSRIRSIGSIRYSSFLFFRFLLQSVKVKAVRGQLLRRSIFIYGTIIYILFVIQYLYLYTIHIHGSQKPTSDRNSLNGFVDCDSLRGMTCSLAQNVGSTAPASFNHMKLFVYLENLKFSLRFFKMNLLFLELNSLGIKSNISSIYSLCSRSYCPISIL